MFSKFENVIILLFVSSRVANSGDKLVNHIVMPHSLFNNTSKAFTDISFTFERLKYTIHDLDRAIASA